VRLRLKLAILAAGKTQRQIAAESLHISENRLSEIVRGWVTPDADEKAMLAQVLGQPIEVLFDEPLVPKAPTESAG